MGDVENAIAMALKKDGIEPPVPKLSVRSSNDNGKKNTEPEHQSSKGKKRKRRRLDKDIAKKEELKKVSVALTLHYRCRIVKITVFLFSFTFQKLKMVEDQIEGKVDIDQSDEMDEYEMLCVRGGSPPPIPYPLITPKNVGSRMDDELYHSDDSYSSYDSYEDRIQKRRLKDRRGGVRNKRDGKRRRDDSEVNLKKKIILAN